MNKIKSKFYETPKLIDCYGDYHEFKIGAEFYDNDLKYHNKKLNIMKEISKEKIQRRKNKENFDRTKIKLKSELKHQKYAIRLEAKNKTWKLKKELKEIQLFIKLSSFTNQIIANIEKEIKQNYNVTKKTVNSLSASMDDVNFIEQKIEAFGKEAYKNDQLLRLKKHLLKKIEKLNFVHNDFSEWKKVDKETIFKKIESLKIDKAIQSVERKFKIKKIEFDKNIHSMLLQQIKIILNAFFNQSFFIYTDKERKKRIVEINKEIEEIKISKKESKKVLVANNAKLIKQKKLEIDKNYKDIYLNLESDLKRFKTNLYQTNSEISQNKEKKAKYLASVKSKIKILKAKHWKKYQVELEQNLKKVKYEENEEIFLSDLISSPKVFPLIKWKEKLVKIQAKINYNENLGNAIKDYSYEGDLKIGNAKALRNFYNNFSQIIETYFKEKKLNESTSKNENKFAEEDAKINKKIENEEFLFRQKKNKLKELLIKKEISKKAYKNAIEKENILALENIRALNFKLSEFSQKYDKQDIFNKLFYSYQMAVRQRDSEMNDVRKKTPIEVGKNSAYWKVILGTILPGSVDLINKNWFKGILLILTSAFVFGFLLPYAFGVFNIQGRGVIGLIQLSWVVDELPGLGPIYVDSRYSLIEGVIGLLFLILAATFLLISAISSWKIARAQEIGVRSNSWSETKKILRNNGFPYAIALPGWVLISLIVFVPISVSILLAFTNIGHFHNPNAGDQTNWVGFEQFIRIFSNTNIFEPFGQVFLWNVIWAVTSSVVVLFLGTVLALMIESRGVKGKIIWRTIFMLPWAIPGFLSILFFKVIFSDSSTGFINSILLDLNIIENAISWQTNIWAARIVLILIQGWLGHSYNVLLISGYMKSISGDVYEAASIDGASNRAQFWKITIPIILMQVAPMIIGQFTYNFNNFALIYLFNEGGGQLSPDFIYQVGNTDILLSWIFKITFTVEGNGLESNQALASAMIVIISLVVVGISGFSFSRTKAFKKGEENV